MTDPTPAPHPTPKPNSLRRLMIAGAFAVTFVAGGAAFSILPAAAAAHGMGGSMHHGGGQHGGMAMMDGHMDKMLDAADASPEQKAKIKAILGDAFGQMHALHDGMGSTHQRLHALLTAPTVDRGAIEGLRVETVGKVDSASRIMTKAMADAAEVLRPDQRAKLGAAMAAHHKGD